MEMAGDMVSRRSPFSEDEMAAAEALIAASCQGSCTSGPSVGLSPTKRMADGEDDRPAAKRLAVGFGHRERPAVQEMTRGGRRGCSTTTAEKGRGRTVVSGKSGEDSVVRVIPPPRKQIRLSAVHSVRELDCSTLPIYRCSRCGMPKKGHVCRAVHSHQQAHVLGTEILTPDGYAHPSPLPPAVGGGPMSMHQATTTLAVPCPPGTVVGAPMSRSHGFAVPAQSVVFVSPRLRGDPPMLACAPGAQVRSAARIIVDP